MQVARPYRLPQWDLSVQVEVGDGGKIYATNDMHNSEVCDSRDAPSVITVMTAFLEPRCLQLTQRPHQRQALCRRSHQTTTSG